MREGADGTSGGDSIPPVTRNHFLCFAAVKKRESKQEIYKKKAGNVQIDSSVLKVNLRVASGTIFICASFLLEL